MTRIRAALLLLLVQLALVSSVAAKYLYERETCPRVWSRATQYDPNLPLRGRYLALHVLIDACQLPRDSAHFQRFMPYGVNPTVKAPGYWTWYVSLGAANGHLVPVLQDHPKNPSDTVQLTLAEGRSCGRVPVSQATEYFIPDSAHRPSRCLPDRNSGSKSQCRLTVRHDPSSSPSRRSRASSSFTSEVISQLTSHPSRHGRTIHMDRNPSPMPVNRSTALRLEPF